MSLRRRIHAPKPHAQGGRQCRQPVPSGRQCRRPAPSAPYSRAQAPRAGGLGASFRSEWGERARRRRQAHAQGPAACGGWGREAAPLAVYSRTQAPREGGGSAASQRLRLRIHAPKPHAQGGRRCRQPVPLARIHAPKPHEQGGRRCRQPVPLAPCSRTQAPRAGGLGASFRFCSGSSAHTRRTAQEQGPSACGGFGRTGRWGNGVRFPAFSSPKTPQAASLCSWACRRLCARPPHSDRNAAHPPPARGAGVRLLRANGTGRPHCGHLPTQKLAKMASMTASEASRPVTLSRRAQALRMSGATTSGLNPS